MKCFNPSITREVTLDSEKYAVNDKYYLKNFSDWDQQIRDWLAERENLELGPEHTVVIAFLRKAFEQNKRHPVVRMITTELSDQFGNEQVTIKYFHNLFLEGIHQAYLVAGLPMQDSCC